jgi:prepilin-type processing-associated H-X9-DG protein
MKQIGLALHNYHDGNNCFPMGCSSGWWQQNQYSIKQNLSAHVALLPFLSQTPVYNAFNFNWGCEDNTTIACYQINQTAQNTVIKEFICPSDPNAGMPDHNNTPNTNNYYGCVGTTTNFPLINNQSLNQSTIDWPSTGMFTLMKPYGIRDVIDGSANTIAFAESAVGTQHLAKRQKLIGMNSVGGIPTGALLLDASSNVAQTLAGVGACDRAWTTGGGTIDDQRGENWAHGAMAMTLFNTVVTPNASNDSWTHCSKISSTSLASYSNSDSYHPGGVNALMGDGSVKFIKDGVSRPTWWALGTRASSEVISADSY